MSLAANLRDKFPGPRDIAVRCEAKTRYDFLNFFLMAEPRT